MFRLVLGVTLVASVAVTLAADAPLSIEADAATQVKADAPIPIKVVVVTMFERGADTGDDPGEFQFWVEREKLDTVYAMPAGFRDARGDGHGLLAICTGIGAARAAASVMALGLDPATRESKTTANLAELREQWRPERRHVGEINEPGHARSERHGEDGIATHAVIESNIHARLG